MENETQLDADALAADLKTYIQDAGYLLVGDNEAPHFRMTVKLRKFAESTTPDSGVETARGLGMLENAAATVSDDGGSGVVGYASRTIDLDDIELPEESKLFTTREWVLVADLIIVEQLESPATFTLGGADEATTSAEFPHGARLVAYARQISLIESEGVNIIQAKMRTAMQKLLP